MTTKHLPEYTPKLPEEVLDRAVALCERSEVYQWELGDFLIEVEDEYASVLAHAVKDVGRWMIQQLAKERMLDASTLRDRRSMARFYPPPIREQYIPPLNYSMLRACKSAGDKWKCYADAALDEPSISVHRMRAMIRKNGDKTPAFVDRWERIVTLCIAMVEDKGAPAWMREACEVVVERNKDEDL